MSLKSNIIDVLVVESANTKLKFELTISRDSQFILFALRASYSSRYNDDGDQSNPFEYFVYN